METTYGRFMNAKKYSSGALIAVFLLIYIAAYFIHLYALHPIPELAGGSGPDLTAVLSAAQEEYPDAELVGYEYGYVLLEPADGSLVLLRLDTMDGSRYRLTKDSAAVEAGYTGEVNFSGLVWSETLELTDGEITGFSGTGEPWIHQNRNSELVYAVIAILLTALGHCLANAVKKSIR